MTELTLHDLMPKGKYKGMRISEIAKSNPKYLQWMIDMDYIKVTEEAAMAACVIEDEDPENQEWDAPENWWEPLNKWYE